MRFLIEDIISKFQKKKRFVAIDVGLSGVKTLLLNTETNVVASIGYAPLQGDCFSNHILSQKQKVQSAIQAALVGFDLTDVSAVVSLSTPSIFTKRISVPKLFGTELHAHIQLEAGNVVPNIASGVKLDYQVLGDSSKANQLEVLLVAVKNEIIQSFVDVVEEIGIPVGIVDVDTFAAQNLAEFSYPELATKRSAVINLGARYASVSISKNNHPLFFGDILVSGRLITEILSAMLGVSNEDAEKIKKGEKLHSDMKQFALSLEKVVVNCASDISRQLGLFTNSVGMEEPLDEILFTGGAALTTGLVEAVAEKTGVPCLLIDPFKNLDAEQALKFASLGEGHTSQFGIAAGLSLRCFGDKASYQEVSRD